MGGGWWREAASSQPEPSEAGLGTEGRDASLRSAPGAAHEATAGREGTRGHRGLTGGAWWRGSESSAWRRGQAGGAAWF